MKINRLEIENFKKFPKQGLDLHPQFTLLVGENGSGKTSLLDALAVAASIWLIEVPDSTIVGSGRIILPNEIRLEPEIKGVRTQFNVRRPVIVRATGQIGGDEHVSWTRQIRADGKRTSNSEARQALQCIRGLYDQEAKGQEVLFPILAYYGAGRAWLP